MPYSYVIPCTFVLPLLCIWYSIDVIYVYYMKIFCYDSWVFTDLPRLLPLSLVFWLCPFILCALFCAHCTPTFHSVLTLYLVPCSPTTRCSRCTYPCNFNWICISFVLVLGIVMIYLVIVLILCNCIVHWLYSTILTLTFIVFDLVLLPWCISFQCVLLYLWCRCLPCCHTTPSWLPFYMGAFATLPWPCVCGCHSDLAPLIRYLSHDIPLAVTDHTLPAPFILLCCMPIRCDLTFPIRYPYVETTMVIHVVLVRYITHYLCVPLHAFIVTFHPGTLWWTLFLLLLIVVVEAVMMMLIVIFVTFVTWTCTFFIVIYHWLFWFTPLWPLTLWHYTIPLMPIAIVIRHYIYYLLFTLLFMLLYHYLVRSLRCQHLHCRSSLNCCDCYRCITLPLLYATLLFFWCRYRMVALAWTLYPSVLLPALPLLHILPLHVFLCHTFLLLECCLPSIRCWRCRHLPACARCRWWLWVPSPLHSIQPSVFWCMPSRTCGV